MHNHTILIYHKQNYFIQHTMSDSFTKKTVAAPQTGLGSLVFKGALYLSARSNQGNTVLPAFIFLWYKILIPWQHRDYRTLTALSLGLRPREFGQLSTIIPHNHGITITYTYIYRDSRLNKPESGSLASLARQLLSIITVRVRWCTCSMWRMLLPCGKLIGLLLFCLLLFLLSILF